jgi:type III pantothenate kinase
VSPLTVEPGVTPDLPLNVDVPREVGADRVVSCVAAIALYGTPLIVVDFGTATRFDCVNRRGEFIGGAIAPGINTAAEALVSRAARLFRVELVRPKDAIGRHTVTNIQSGMIYGWAGLVDGLVERMRREMEGDVKVVGTGGLVGQMREVVQCLQFVNADLKLEGLRMLWERAHPGVGG